VAVLVAVLLALAWTSAAAASQTFHVSEDLTASYGYSETLDNPCTTNIPESITLDETFHIEGDITFTNNGTIKVKPFMTIDSHLTGTDTNGVRYWSNHRNNFRGVEKAVYPVRFDGVFLVQNDGGLPNFWLWVRFQINPPPQNPSDHPVVTFSPPDSNGFDRVTCGS
jgi:hypothetical protein